MRTITNKRPWRWTTRLRLILAGWRPNRNVWNRLKLPGSLFVFAEAQRILTEFGNLRFGPRDDWLHFDPSMGEEIIEEIRFCEQRKSIHFYPVGAMKHQDEVYIVVDENGIVYTLEVYPTRVPGTESSAGRLQDVIELEPLASSFDQAIEFLIRHRSRRCEGMEDLGADGMVGNLWRLDSGGSGNAGPSDAAGNHVDLE